MHTKHIDQVFHLSKCHYEYGDKISFLSKRSGTSTICKVVSSLPQFGVALGRSKVPKTLNFKARPSTKFYLREKNITIITTEWPAVLGAPDADFAGP